MSRSLKKGPFIDENLLKKVKANKPDDKNVLKTWARDSMISPEMLNYTVGVYNGKTFINVKVAEDMVGHKFGEFAPTTRFTRHGGKMQREIESKVDEKEAVATAAAAVPAKKEKPAPKK